MKDNEHTQLCALKMVHHKWVTNECLFHFQYPTQVCHLSTLYYWSMEVESGIQKLKHDRKALSIVYKKFHSLSSKMYATFNKTLSKGEKELKSTVQHIRLENLATVSSCFHFIFILFNFLLFFFCFFSNVNSGGKMALLETAS